MYETILTVDLSGAMRQLASLADVPPDVLAVAVDSVTESILTGELTMGQAVVRRLPELGIRPRKGLADQLDAADRRFLHENARAFDDAVHLLRHLREKGVPVALVSNCATNTRSLICALGLDVYVKAMILSCEVGVTKPGAGIYRSALERLGVHPAAAVLIDDQLRYCEGAMELGIHAIHLVRNPSDASTAARPGGPEVISSCRQLLNWRGNRDRRSGEAERFT